MFYSVKALTKPESVVRKEKGTTTLCRLRLKYLDSRPKTLHPNTLRMSKSLTHEPFSLLRTSGNETVNKVHRQTSFGGILDHRLLL